VAVIFGETTMPWSPEEFSSKHNHKLSGKAARGASEAANKALASGKSDASAIRIGNSVGDKVKGFAMGGAMSMPTPGNPHAGNRDWASDSATPGNPYAGGGNGSFSDYRSDYMAQGGLVGQPPTEGVSSSYPPPPGQRKQGPRNYGK
jgi:hypothetical protein